MRILLPRPVSSVTTNPVFQECSGGNSRPSRPSGVGGGTLFGVKRKRSTPHVQRSVASSERGMSWPLGLALVALIAALLIGFIFYRTETWPMRTTHEGIGETERVARDVKNAFVSILHLQPRITVNNRVYVEQTTPTSELVLVSRQIEVEHEFVHTWMGSSKRVKLHGT